MLGRTAKLNVARPRALISQPVKAESEAGNSKENTDQRQRQALWKGRIYCDQAYQAYLKVVETWLLLKLPKGRILLACVLEQALLPPAAVDSILPALLSAIYALPFPPLPYPNSVDVDVDATSANALMVDNHLFVAMGRVLYTLPDLPGSEILQCLDVAQEYSTVSLQSKARMAAVHAVLQRGTQLASSDDEFTPEWKTREDAFMKVLSV